MTDILLFLTGVIAGIVNAVAGGGAVFVFPALLLAGLTPIMAASSSIAIISPGILAAVYGFRKELKEIEHRYYLFIIPAILGGLTGALLLISTPGHTFKYIVPWLVIASVALFAFQSQIHEHLHKPAHLRVGSPFSLLLIFVFLGSVYGSYAGPGFGFIILTMLGFTKLKNVYQISALKNVVASCIVVICTIIFALNGRIDWHHVAAPAVGTLIGGLIGAKIGHKLSPHFTRALVISAGIGLFILLIREI